MIRALLLLVWFCAAARAETVVELAGTKARLELPDGWTSVGTAVPKTGPTGKLWLYMHDNGSVLAVTRADVPNPDAWKSETKQAYADEVERGIGAKLPRYKRVSKRLTTANGVPALDVEAKRDGGATVIIRVLLFRTYALSLAIEVPKGGDRAIARKIAAAFAPANP